MAEGSLAAENLGFQDREYAAEAQVVPEGAVLVLIGEEGILVLVLFDFDDFVPHSSGEILGPGGRQDARKDNGGKDSFHMLK